MKEGDVIITPLLQANGKIRNRPAVILRQMPPYGDLLVCGVSTKLHQFVSDFDELIKSSDPDFAESGLVTDSVIRLGFLVVLPRKSVLGTIGTITAERHKRLLQNLSSHLVKDIK